MGRVYEGIDTLTNSRIALKVLHDDVARDEVSLERFKREYEISRLLPHDHIVSVLDFQCDGGSNTWLLVMEYLDGEELRCVLKRDRVLAPDRLIRILSQVAIGLDEANSRNFIHRDLKPDNIFLCGTREGDVVKLLDFGSVKDQSGHRKKLTMLGTTIGSPYYMSPEQAQGLDSIDARADVFALGAVTYECVTGLVPFNGVNGPSILLAILTSEPVPPSRCSSESVHRIPPELDRVLARAMAKRPAMRFSSAGHYVDAVGHAYGLSGSHKEWACAPQRSLAQWLEAVASEDHPTRVEPLDEAADPFATVTATADEFPESASASDEPPRNAPSFRIDSYRIPARAAWVLPVVVAVVALVVGGAATFMLLSAR